MEDNIVFYPCPARGHVFSMIELAKFICKYHPSVSITIIIANLPLETISATDPFFADISATIPSVTFIQLPSVSLPPDSIKDIDSLLFELPQLNNPNFHKVLLSLSESYNIKALVIDFFCNAAVQVSSTLNIPTYYYYTSGASTVNVLTHLSTLHENIQENFKDLDILLEIPGLPFIPSRDMPVTLLDRSYKIYSYFLETGIQMIKSSGIIINSFEALEQRAVKALVEGKCSPDKPTPPIYCIGPVIATSAKKNDKQKECLTWLDSQPGRSVVFLCFGSMGVLPANQLKEMAIGLEKSSVRFLWVVRNPVADGESKSSLTHIEPDLESFLPEGFLERTKDRGLVIKLWAPQVAVLNHGSIGGFVTHCGWNSVLEAVCAGVPMLAWPLFAEQKLNKIFMVEEMKVALEVKQSEEGFVSAAELEERVAELMESEKGKGVGDRVIGLKEEAARALSDGGSSRVALAKLVKEMKLTYPVVNMSHDNEVEIVREEKSEKPLTTAHKPNIEGLGPSQ